MTSPDERVVALLQEARRQLELERRRRSEPIALVGIGCRFPGGADTPARFWQLLLDGIDATSDVPADRWNADQFYDPNPEAPGKSYTKRGSFLDQVDGFDAAFFGISAREALSLDPQQRLLLEVTWEALEDAAIPPSGLRGSATGVWIGSCVDDYARRCLFSADPVDIDAYSTLGNMRSVAAGRISYIMDLHGPALQIDTACSSSLVAVHQACQSLRARECDLALVGGVNLMLAPESMVALSKLRALSPDGRCKTFDAAADGYGRGEGCGIVVLERLSDARAARRRIYALLRGSAVNHDGHSNGLTAPSGIAQEMVMRAALANAGVEAREVGYVETHGTGTLLGDPIEVLALQRVYGADRRTNVPLLLGAVKTNFGHLEGAAGIAGLIKSALSLREGAIPRHLHLQRPNPKIPWSNLAVKVADSLLPWPRAAEARKVGVSSFGISGTNAHVVLEEAPEVEDAASAPGRSAELLMLSAKTEEALKATAARLRECLEVQPELGLGDVAYSLATTRTLFEERLALSVGTRAALLAGLRQAELAELPTGATRGAARDQRGKLAWLFTGQGAQRVGMGRGLYAEWRAFRDAFDEACASIDPLLDRPLRAVMWAQEGSAEAALLDQTGYTQPALFVLGWALSRLWRSWRVEPELLLGHSIGEITAACVAGVFSLPDGARLVCSRARLMQALPPGGAMLAIAARASEVAAAVSARERTVAIAAVNGPAATVIAGVEAEVSAIRAEFSARGIRTTRLSVSHAFHSPLMDPMLEEFRQVAQSLKYQAPTVPLISNLNGQLAGQELMSADYWVRHVRQTVRFADGVSALEAAGARSFLELGPRATLLGLASEVLTASDAILLPSLRSGRSEADAVLEAAGGWVARGGTLEWEGIFPEGGRRVALPTYPWQRQRFWLDAPSTAGNQRAELRRRGDEPASSSQLESARATLPGSIQRGLPALSGTGAEEIRRAVRAEIQRVLAVTYADDVPLTVGLSDLGLDSLKILELRSALRRRAGVPLAAVTPEMTGEAISKLVLAALEAPEDSEPPAHFELIRSVAVPQAQLFCFPDAGGDSALFRPFAMLAREDVEIHVISHRRPPKASTESALAYLEAVAHYIRTVAKAPLALLGHSLGGWLAWRVLQELESDGRANPVLLMPSSVPAPVPGETIHAETREAITRALLGPRRMGAADLESFGRDVDADLSLWTCMPRSDATLRTSIAAILGRSDNWVTEKSMLGWQQLTSRDFSMTLLPGDHWYPYQAGPRALLLEEISKRLRQLGVLSGPQAQCPPSASE